MFSKSTYESMYKRFMGPLARPVSLLVQSGQDYIAYNTTAHVTKYQESDLVAGGSVQLGDLRIILLADDVADFGIDKLTQKDRINVDGLTYSVIHWDAYTRTVGPDNIAIEVAVRGGGSAVIASVAVYRITGTGDIRVTGDGDMRIIREAV